MADAVKVTLNRTAVANLLRSEPMANLANAAARRVAAAIGDDARVSEYTTDRRAASVSVPTYRQARDGALTRAAARAGLEVRSK